MVTRQLVDDTIFLLTANGDPATYRLFMERLTLVAANPGRAYSVMSALSTFAIRLILAPPAPGSTPDQVIQEWRDFMDSIADRVTDQFEGDR